MSTAETYGFWIAITFAAVVWFLPTIIAMVRGLDGGDILTVLTLNLLGVGWPAAMIGAFFPKDRLPPDRGPNPYYNPYWRNPPRPAGWVPPPTAADAARMRTSRRATPRSQHLEGRRIQQRN